MKKIIFLFIIFATLNCASTKKNILKNSSFDFGKTKSGLYTNDYFNLKIPFNPNWAVQDKQQVNNLVDVGNDLVAGENENLKAIVKAAQVNTAYLLTVFKHEVGAAVEFNPSLIVVSENTKNFPGIKDGSDYLFHAKNLLLQSQMAYEFEKEVYERTIGKSTFHVLEAKLNYPNQTVIQEYMSTVTKGFSLSFIITYSSEADKGELYKVIDKIKI